MGESERDSGLARVVGPWGLGLSVVNTVVGAGIFAVPAALAASIGPYAPLAFLVCAIAVGSVAVCFAEGGSRIPTSGGAYGTIEAAFGPLVGHVAGTLLWFSNLLACGGIAAALADMTVSLLPAAARGAAHAGVIALLIAGIALVNVAGVAQGTRLVRAATMVKLLPFAVFLVAGACAVHLQNFATVAAPSTGGVGRALILALFAFSGMETALSASGEVANPARTIPRALGAAMLSVMLLYIAIQIIAEGVLGPALSESAAPLADAMGRVSPALRVLMLAGAGLSMFGYIGSDVLGTPRVLFAFARDGLLPRALGRVHPRTRAPHVAIACYAAVAIGLALTGTFTELAILLTLAVAPLYMAGCAAAWRLRQRGVALAGAPLGFRGLGAAAVTGITSMIVMIALASRAEILGLVALVGVSAAAYPVLARGRRRSLAAS